jgi:hypothetical protein
MSLIAPAARFAFIGFVQPKSHSGFDRRSRRIGCWPPWRHAGDGRRAAADIHIGLEAPQPKSFPDEVDDIADPHFFENAARPRGARYKPPHSRPTTAGPPGHSVTLAAAPSICRSLLM